MKQKPKNEEKEQRKIHAQDGIKRTNHGKRSTAKEETDTNGTKAQNSTELIRRSTDGYSSKL